MVVVGELLASVALKTVCSKLANATLKEVARQLNFSKDLKFIKDVLSSIQYVLKDAERQSSTQQTVRHWLKMLKNVAFDLEDILLDFETTMSTWKGEVQGSGTATKGLLALLKRLDMPHKLETMRGRIKTIQDLNKFNFREDTSTYDEVIKNRETFSRTSEIPFGRMEEKEAIMSLLQTGAEFAVPVYGLGGIGKTTVVRMVYNDDRITDFFDDRAWVYVSVKFDINAIGRAIISQLDGSSGCNR